MDRLLFAIADLHHTLQKRLTTPMGRGGVRRRGMALVVVFTTVAIMATSVVEYVYNTRVNLFLAQNQRDEIKAYFLARSGVNLMRLALAYQGELEEQGGLVGRAVSRSNFQLWQYLDLLLPTFSSGQLNAGDFGSLDLQEQGATGFGDLNGSIEFNRPEPEEGKINLNEFASEELNQEVLAEFCSMLRPPAYDDLLGSAADRAAQDRFEVIGAIIDYIDPDSDTTLIDENCIVQGGGLGNESSRYVDVDYEAKNEAFVTLDEVLLVPGVTEAFFRQFEDNLTVYPIPAQFFPNLQDAQGFAGFLCANIVGANEDITPCVLPAIAEQVGFLSLALEGYVEFFSNPFNVLNMWMGGGSMGAEDFGGALANGQMMAFRNARDFTGVLNSFMGNPELALYFLSFADPARAQLFGYYASLGVQVLPPQFAITFDEAAMIRRISVATPSVFTIEASGVYGGATRTITTVVSLDNDEGGRLLYWREF